MTCRGRSRSCLHPARAHGTDRNHRVGVVSPGAAQKLARGTAGIIDGSATSLRSVATHARFRRETGQAVSEDGDT